jgi:hypothetical protein
MLSLKDQVRILYESGQSSLGLSGMRAPWRKSGQYDLRLLRIQQEKAGDN